MFYKMSPYVITSSKLETYSPLKQYIEYANNLHVNFCSFDYWNSIFQTYVIGKNGYLFHPSCT
jgi:hypothetical protein